MGLEFAIDALYETNFEASQASPCRTHSDGRPYPCLDAVEQCFATAGFGLSVRHIQLFHCYRAEWRDSSGQAAGAVVGQSAEEAAVYALSLLRREQAQSLAGADA